MLCSILRNNSFYGTIPEEIVDLKQLEILDLGYNNFSGHLDANFGHNITSLAILYDDTLTIAQFFITSSFPILYDDTEFLLVTVCLTTMNSLLVSPPKSMN